MKTTEKSKFKNIFGEIRRVKIGFRQKNAGFEHKSAILKYFLRFIFIFGDLRLLFSEKQIFLAQNTSHEPHLR